MAFVPVIPSLGFPPIAEARTLDDGLAGRSSPGPWLGRIIGAVDPSYGNGEFIYLKGVTDTAIGSAVTYNADDFTTTLLVADAIGPVAVAMSACDAVTKGGWYQISGKAVIKSGTVVDNANVYATATPGQVDDAVVQGDLVHNAKFASANGTPSTGLAECEISRPFVDNDVDDLDVS